MRTPLRIALVLLQGLTLSASALWGFVPAAPALAAPAPLISGPVTLTADRIEYNSQTNVATADGNVRVETKEVVLTADHLEYDAVSQEVTATGHVTLKRGGNTATGDLLKYNLSTREGKMEPVVAQYGPMHVLSRTLETAGGQAVAYDATITTCDPKNPIYKVTAKRVVIIPGDHLTAYDASVYVANTRVFTLPSYTTTLVPGEKKRRSGPSFGYTYLDGPFVQYNWYFPIGGAENYFRVRYATMTSFSAENVTTDRVNDHLWTLDLGRNESFNEQNNLQNVDQASLTVAYDDKRPRGWPLIYHWSASVGTYTELAGTSVNTASSINPTPISISSPQVSSTRAQALGTFTTDSFQVAKNTFVAAGGLVRYDTYGIGQQRFIVGGSVAATTLLGGPSSVTYSYHFDSISGSTPFQFDLQNPASAANITYSYVSSGFLQLFSVGATYDFLALQTIIGANFTMAVAKGVLLSVAPLYNVSTGQLNEVDYALNVKCDCITANFVYRTFPQNPSANQFVFTIGLSELPGAFNF